MSTIVRASSSYRLSVVLLLPDAVVAAAAAADISVCFNFFSCHKRIALHTAVRIQTKNENQQNAAVALAELH